MQKHKMCQTKRNPFETEQKEEFCKQNANKGLPAPIEARVWDWGAATAETVAKEAH